MLFLSNISIKKRLTALIMAASSLSVLLTVLIVSLIGIYNLRAGMIDELTVSASIVGDRNAAAIDFGLKDQAESNLRVFSLKQNILQACLYDKEGKIFASYVSDENPPAAACPADQYERVIVGENNIEVFKYIIKMNEQIGSIYIQSDMREIASYIRDQTYIALFVMLAGLVFSYLLAISLQHNISRPILSLAATAREVSVNKDYAVRANPFGGKKRGGKDELSVLTNSFNGMLSEIGERDRQLKQQNVLLEKARDAAEAANRAKSQFLANISHELRTPLNAIIGFSSILMNQLFGPLGDNKYTEYAQDINESGTHLLDIINDILDLSKAEAGKLDLNFEEVHVGKAIAKCMTILSEKAVKGRITMTSDVPKSLPPLVVDRLRFIQIVLNVLSNAVKFTEEGGKVHIAVGTKEEGGEVAQFLITVVDTGIGMAKDDIAKAFQSFGQVDSGLNRKYEGTGLGLPLTKKLLELHGGDIHIESELGVGTTVAMIFPAVPPNALENVE